MLRRSGHSAGANTVLTGQVSGPQVQECATLYAAINLETVGPADGN